jgi:transcriptional regulator with PAS, ATPase and Fis domain
MNPFCRSYRSPAVDLAAMRTARQWLANFSHASAIGVAISDASSRFQCVNPALARINGITPESHTNNTLRDVVGDMALTIDPILLQVKATALPVVKRISGKIPNAGPGTDWFTTHVPLVRSGYRNVIGWGAIVVDITPLVRIESMLRGFRSSQVLYFDPETRRFIDQLRQSVKGYSTALSSTTASVVQSTWRTEQVEDVRFCPIIQLMDERILEMRRLIEGIEANLEWCLFPRN